MARKFIGDNNEKFKVAMKRDDGKTVYLLWGDSVEVLQVQGNEAQVQSGRSRNEQGQLVSGKIPASVLTDQGLLELYVIDVGQGDGVLLRTPDDAWHVIDAGVANEAQMTKKGAANFIRWKFQDDLGRPGVDLKNVIVTHPDFDHYGGLLNLLAGRLEQPPRTFAITVENFFHSGMGRFKTAPKLGQTKSGTVAPLPFDDYGVSTSDSFITELLDQKSSFTNPPRPLEDSFADLAQLVGQVPQNVRRLSHRDKWLPGYSPADGGAVNIRILGPVLEEMIGNGLGLREFDSESVTRNGHSIVLRIDFDKIRILLTGDLNTASQKVLLSYHGLLEFMSDVAKGCHHGSDDIDLRFVKAMKARCTVVSSGDNEDYAHPRPRVLGASARYGRESKGTDGKTLPPLLYSTELARSVSLDFAASVRPIGGATIAADGAEIKAAAQGSKFVPLPRVPISTNLIYGLINIRTDGTRVLSAYMEEQGVDFDIKAFRGGVEP